jgi:hypothetical protein
VFVSIRLIRIDLQTFNRFSNPIAESGFKRVNGKQKNIPDGVSTFQKEAHPG